MEAKTEGEEMIATIPEAPQPKPSLEDAIALAVVLHKGQVDKAGRPYILHPLRVMLDKSLTTDEEKMTAVLHDVVEDCGITFDELKALGYSDAVVEALRFVTKLPEEEKNYPAFIARVCGGSVLAKKVKLADVRDNADSSRVAKPNAWDIGRLQKYRRAILELEAALQ